MNYPFFICSLKEASYCQGGNITEKEYFSARLFLGELSLGRLPIYFEYSVSLRLTSAFKLMIKPLRHALNFRCMKVKSDGESSIGLSLHISKVVSIKDHQYFLHHLLAYVSALEHWKFFGSSNNVVSVVSGEEVKAEATNTNILYAALFLAAWFFWVLRLIQNFLRLYFAGFSTEVKVARHSKQCHYGLKIKIVWSNSALLRF